MKKFIKCKSRKFLVYFLAMVIIAAQFFVFSPATPVSAAYTNLALGKNITASSNYPGYVASNANDGDITTYWEGSPDTYPNTLTVDLGNSAEFGSVAIKLNPDPIWATRTQTLSVLGSNDNSTYTTIVGSATYTFDPATGNAVTITFSNVTYRYVRLNITANSGATGGQAGEFEVYGSRGATLPYTEYEAESAATNGTVLDRSADHKASQASGLKVVNLDATGEYVEFTVTNPANSIVVRYCIPDSSDGSGIQATLSLYKNNEHSQDLSLTSKYAWSYGNYPFSNNPSDGNVTHYFDEMRATISNVVAGDKIKLQKDSGDTAAYYLIDLIDLENVPAALSQPANSLSVTDYGAVANDSNDDSNAIANCIAAAKSQGKSVWIPAGTYQKTSGAVAMSDHTGYSGSGFVAGYWTIGATTTFVTHVTSVGTYNITLRYSNGTGSSKTITKQYQGTYTQITLPPTANWDTWADYTFTQDLDMTNFDNPGDNHISFIYMGTDSGNVNLDYLSVNGTKYEAENALLTCPIYVDNITVQGAGMWHTTISGDFASFQAVGSNIKVSDISVFGETNRRIDAKQDNAFGGFYGTNSVISNVWMEHVKCGFWIGNHQDRTNNTDGLRITGCRIRNVMADGLNFCYGTQNSIVEQTHVRGTGDDGLAMWSYPGGPSNSNNVFRFNTIQTPWMAHGLAIYGGTSNKMEDNLIYDVVSGSGGIIISSGFSSTPFVGTTYCVRNTVTRCGAYDNGAIKIDLPQRDISGLVVDSCHIVDSKDVGLMFGGSYTLSDATFNNINIVNATSYGILIMSEVKGSATFNYVTVQNTQLQPFLNSAGSNFTVNKGPGCTGW